MALQLSPRVQRQISEKIASGKYPDADAVIEKALQALTEEEKFLRLKAMIAIGVEQSERDGVVGYKDAFVEEERLAARRRAAARKKQNPDVCP